MLRRFLAFLLPAVTTFAPLSAQATLLPSNVLRVHFRMATSQFPRPDTLLLNLGRVTVNQAFGTRRATLYDGDLPLGAGASTSFGSFVGQLGLDSALSWRTTASLYRFDNPAVSDLTTVANGTIRGIVDFTIDAGSITIPLSQVALSAGFATSGNSMTPTQPAPVVTEARIVPRMALPTPGTLGTVNTWKVTGALANGAVVYGIGTICQPIQLGGIFWDIANPVVFVQVPIDANGTGVLAVNVPLGGAGARILVQGFQVIGLNLDFTSLSAFTF